MARVIPAAVVVWLLAGTPLSAQSGPTADTEGATLETGIWRDYRAEMIAGAGLLGLQALLIAALLAQRARRREVEARNEATLRAMPDMVFLLTREGRFLSAHAPRTDDLLRPPEEFIGRLVREVLPPAIASEIEAAFTRLDAGQPAIVHYELPINGDERHFEARLVPCHHDGQVLALVRNVTDMRRAERELAEGQDRYARATVAGRVGVWDWDLETNAVYVDPLLKRVLGYADDEIQNHMDAWGALVHPDDQALVASRVQEHLEGRTAVFEVEHRMRHRDGSVRWFLARGSATHVDGRAVRVVGTDTDITAQKTTEAALLEAQAELGRLSRLTALGQFAASIAHEVRQPLTAMIANAQAGLQWLRTGDDPGFRRTEAALAEVLAAARRADLVIRRSGELFRNRPVQKLALDVNRTIEEVAALAAFRLRTADVTLVLELDPDLPVIDADRIEIQQVLLNLLINSVDAMETVEPDRRRIAITTAAEPGEGVEVAVTDTGVGFEGVDLERMFSPTYTTKPAGTGVGLAICRSVIESHGGRIRAVANAGGGATFAFSLPLQADVRTTSPMT